MGASRLSMSAKSEPGPPAVMDNYKYEYTTEVVQLNEEEEEEFTASRLTCSEVLIITRETLSQKN